ncbi:MAG: hypothetical protein PHD76_11985, partial [Methylacidiphilales bacterium]|nr:hypothetical protein [Candidatus Methylacidiphilales bacterium]
MHLPSLRIGVFGLVACAALSMTLHAETADQVVLPPAPRPLPPPPADTSTTSTSDMTGGSDSGAVQQNKTTSSSKSRDVQQQNQAPASTPPVPRGSKGPEFASTVGLRKEPRTGFSFAVFGGANLFESLSGTLDSQAIV